MQEENSGVVRLDGAAGLNVEVNANGSIRRMSHGSTTVNLFLGNELEGGPANLYLRRHRPAPAELEFIPLLGPRSSTRFPMQSARNQWMGAGSWYGVRYTITLTLSESAPAWFWHVSLENAGEALQHIDLIYTQDIALAPYDIVRLNEYYVSQYVDHTALNHEACGWVVASRQNLASAGRNPWCMIGSLRRGRAYATDALQVHGLSSRSGASPSGIVAGLPAQRLQHEHSMVAVQDESLRLQPDGRAMVGFFGLLSPDHPSATSASDLACVDEALALREASPVPVETRFHTNRNENITSATHFSTASMLATDELELAELHELFPGPWRHEEYNAQGKLLSFFYQADRHVVLREKELHTRRPHGHLLRTGQHTTPDEAALTSTTWMAGVFHSMLTQGHVSFNRCLSTVRSYIGLFQTHGQRVFVGLADGWRLLDIPSAYEMTPQSCRWIYKHAAGTIEVRSEAHSDPHEMLLIIQVLVGRPLRFMVTHHLAVGGDDGNTQGVVRWSRNDTGITISPPESSDLHNRFPAGTFEIRTAPGTMLERAGTDEMLFLDGRSRREPYICLVTARSNSIGLKLRADFVTNSVDVPTTAASQVPHLHIAAPAASPLADAVARLADIAPWFTHNAFIHYLSPRGLEQFSGGGWGTRDVTQGPLEMLLAVGDTGAVRDLLLRVMSAQAPDGDWPQWFMFFQRDRNVRAGDSHGDIVFWPVLALAQYLLASGDATILEERLTFFAPKADDGEEATVWQHIERALALIERRVIQGTALAAYGHGDWNDALQPADPAMREHMCSAWTVTLHYQTLVTLARALRVIGRSPEAARLEANAEAVQEDFRRLLLIDGVLTGYALFEDGGNVRYLLHPRDGITGVSYSSLAMIHAILNDMLPPASMREHLQLIKRHLSGPDGVRLFDRPMQYHGGPQRFFQRAESATFFGREIGLMYMHAHLRYAQALAHIGDAEGFFQALCQSNPIGIRSIVPTATLRQANCYYSSSDAAFTDRYQASAEYDSVAQGEIALDGGWRVYSSGAGIALALIIRRFLGLSQEFNALSLDPVMPATLNGLRVEITLLGRLFEVHYEVKDPGCGVTAVRLNGTSLPLTYETNPHRKGAARVLTSALQEWLADGRNVLTISVG